MTVYAVGTSIMFQPRDAIAQYDALVRYAGWSEERYLAWLTATITATVHRHCD